MTVPAEPPPNEDARLAALRQYAILDTEPEACFDRIARLAARKFAVPIALISLIDEDRQWFKANCGLDARETGRDVAFCAHAILSGGIFMVPDATKDPRFANNPLVTDGLQIRFYAGAPLVAPSGLRLGTLCLIDTKPRPCLSEADQAELREMAAIVVDEMEMRAAAGDPPATAAERTGTQRDPASAESHTLDLFFFYAPAALAMLDQDLRYLAASRRWLDLLGVAEPSVVGRHHFDVVADLPEPLRTRYRQCLTGAMAAIEEETRLGANGSARAVRHQVQPWRDRRGRIGGLIVLLTPVDEHEATPAEPEHQRVFLEAVLQSLRDGVVACDADGRLCFFNEATRRLHGVDRERLAPSEWVGRYELFEADGQTPLAAERMPLYRALSGETVDGDGLVIAPRDGHPHRIVAHGRSLYDTEGRKLGAAVSMHDAGAAQAADEALLASEERYRRLYTMTPVMLHSIDRDGRLLSVSDCWLDRLGYRREEVIGRRSVEFLTPESAAYAAEKALPDFLRTGVCQDVPYQVLTKTGEVLDVLLSAVAEYQEDGTFSRSMAVLVDVTDRKTMERQLVQAQKMESVGQLTGGLAHDFNNLLGVILGNLQLIERAVRADDRAMRRLAAAIGAVERGAELTRRLLAFSRRQKLETVSVDPNPLIDGMSDMLRRTLGESIALNCRLGDGMPMVRTDVSQLESAILNLAVNARDAMPDGGTLTIESSAVHLDEDYAAREHEVTPGDYVALSVTDTGIGIPAEVIDKAFEPFFTTKGVGKGSGLGLSMVYGFMKQSGGHVRVYSEVGHGTTVRLYLPVDEQTRPPAPDPAAEDMQNLRGRETILLVEDQDEVRDIAVALLEDLGYAVLQARCGREGLATLQSAQRIDLLLTDIVMPGGMNGTQLADAARTLRPELPIVFTTGYAEAAVLHQGDVKKASNLVTKPYRRVDLAARIRQALDERRDVMASAVPAAG